MVTVTVTFFFTLYFDETHILFFLYFLAKVIFNESHWMTSQASIIYLKHLITLFPGKKIGLIWDKHSSHYCDEVMQFIKKNNNDNNNNNTTIIPALVDEGLTPIIQVPDVAINKIFKQKLKEQYYKYRLEMKVEIGKKLRVSREKVVEFILQSIDHINGQSTHSFLIHDAFKYCGLNPWSMDNSMKAFTEHLNQLESNHILKAMIMNQTAVQLE
jgi:hypothetical protein